MRWTENINYNYPTVCVWIVYCFRQNRLLKYEIVLCFIVFLLLQRKSKIKSKNEMTKAILMKQNKNEKKKLFSTAGSAGSFHSFYENVLIKLFLITIVCTHSPKTFGFHMEKWFTSMLSHILTTDMLFRYIYYTVYVIRI